jgi:hypothetical protein
MKSLARKNEHLQGIWTLAELRAWDCVIAYLLYGDVLAQDGLTFMLQLTDAPPEPMPFYTRSTRQAIILLEVLSARTPALLWRVEKLDTRYICILFDTTFNRRRRCIVRAGATLSLAVCCAVLSWRGIEME